MQQSSDVAKQPGRSLDLYTLHKNNCVAITTQKVVVIISGGSHDSYWVKRNIIP